MAQMSHYRNGKPSHTLAIPAQLGVCADLYHSYAGGLAGRTVNELCLQMFNSPSLLMGALQPPRGCMVTIGAETCCMHTVTPSTGTARTGLVLEGPWALTAPGFVNAHFLSPLL